MNRVRPILALTVLAVGLSGVYWAVCAQEGRPVWPKPEIVPPGVQPPQDFPIGTGQGGAVTEEIIPVGGLVPPPPMFPQGDAKKSAAVPPPLPPLIPEVKSGLEKKSSPVPLPPSIKEPPAKEAIKPETAPELPSLVLPPLGNELKKDASPKPLPAPETPPAVPPLLIPDAPKPAPAPLPTPTVTPSPAALQFPEPKKDLVPQPGVGGVERLKSFVPIRPTGQGAPAPIVGPGPIAPPSSIGAVPGIAPAHGATVQTASVSVEKRGPLRLRAGEIQPFQIIVRNLGPVSAQNVRIEDELPASVQITSAELTPAVSNGRAIWTLPALAVHQEQTVRVMLRASGDVDVPTRIGVTVSASAQGTVAMRPQQIAQGLSIQVKPPAQIVVGRPAVFEVRVANQSARPVSSLTLYGVLPEGLHTPQGREIEGAIDGTFLPGDSRTLKMPASAVKPGRYTVHARIASADGLQATDAVTIDIGADGLLVQQTPVTPLLLGRDGDLRIDVTNPSDRTLRNVVVTDRLPEGVDFVAASDRGLFQANSRTVYWLIEQLLPGQSKTLFVRMHGAKGGEHNNVVTGKADGIAEMQTSSVLRLEGSGELTMRVIARDNHLELGRETVYEVQIQNPGRTTASNLQLQAQFSPGMTPRSAEASVRHAIDRQTVTFEPMAGLNPHQNAVFRVTAIGQAAGDQRVRFLLVSDQVRIPIQREVSTIVYRD